MARLLSWCVLVGWGGGLVSAAWAQSQYLHKVTAPIGLEYLSNPGLTSNGSAGVYRWRVSPSYALTHKTGTEELNLKLGAVLEQSSDTSLSRNRQDGNAQVEWRRESESWLYTLRAAYEQSAARAALLEETGQLSEDGTRTTRSLGGTLVRELDLRHALTGALDVKWAHYDFGSNPDNRLTSAKLEWSRAVAAGEDWFVAGSLLQYVPEVGASNGGSAAGTDASLQRGVMLGYRSKVPGSAWEWSARAGVASFTGLFSDTTTQGEIKLGYEGQRWSTSAALSRLPVANNLLSSFAPNTQVRLRTEYRLTEFTNIVLEASRNRTTATQTDTARVVAVAISTELSSLWRMSAQLKHTQVDRATSVLGAQASGRAASLVFTYLHPDF